MLWTEIQSGVYQLVVFWKYANLHQEAKTLSLENMDYPTQVSNLQKLLREDVEDPTIPR